MLRSLSSRSDCNTAPSPRLPRTDVPSFDNRTEACCATGSAPQSALCGRDKKSWPMLAQTAATWRPMLGAPSAVLTVGPKSRKVAVNGRPPRSTLGASGQAFGWPSLRAETNLLRTTDWDSTKRRSCSARETQSYLSLDVPLEHWEFPIAPMVPWS